MIVLIALLLFEITFHRIVDELMVVDVMFYDICIVKQFEFPGNLVGKDLLKGNFELFMLYVFFYLQNLAKDYPNNQLKIFFI